MKAGNNRMAETHYRKSLELNPDNQNAVDMLRKMEEARDDEPDE